MLNNIRACSHLSSENRIERIEMPLARLILTVSHLDEEWDLEGMKVRARFVSPPSPAQHSPPVTVSGVGLMIEFWNFTSRLSLRKIMWIYYTTLQERSRLSGMSQYPFPRVKGRTRKKISHRMKVKTLERSEWLERL